MRDSDSAPTGEQMVRVLTALGNPHRMRIIAALTARRNYVSRLAREIGMSRPLLHMHLARLEAAGLVVGTLELSDDGKAMRYFEVAPFIVELTPQSISDAAATLPAADEPDERGATSRSSQPHRANQTSRTSERKRT